jgi:tRNA (guanine37-N1)-methyltransferase
MRFTVITIFPQFFDSGLAHGLLEKAVDDQKVQVDIVDLRDFAKGRHRQTDDTAFGGGPGMVMMPAPLALAIDHAKHQDPSAKVIALSPGGRRLSDSLARDLANEKGGLIFICGRYEGIDQRILDHYCDDELSIGDYVLTGGEPAALVAIDAISRRLPGVIGDPESVDRDSFTRALAHPQYTRPREFFGHEVPEALTSGDHKRIAKWRKEAAWLRTATHRPDLLGQIENDSTWLSYWVSPEDVQKQKTPAVLKELCALCVAYRLGGIAVACSDTQFRAKIKAALCAFLPDDSPVLVKRSVEDLVTILEKKKKTRVLVVDAQAGPKGSGAPALTDDEKLAQGPLHRLVVIRPPLFDAPLPATLAGRTVQLTLGRAMEALPICSQATAILERILHPHKS